MNEIHVGDIGTLININVKNPDNTPVNLSSFSSTTLVMKRSDASIVERTCSFVTDGTDGKIQYTSVSSDFTVPGNYKFQIRCVNGGDIWHSNIVTQKVYINVGN